MIEEARERGKKEKKGRGREEAVSNKPPSQRSFHSAPLFRLSQPGTRLPGLYRIRFDTPRASRTSPLSSAALFERKAARGEVGARDGLRISPLATDRFLRSAAVLRSR